MKSKPPGENTYYSFQTPELAALAIDVWQRDHGFERQENTMWQTTQDRWDKGIIALSFYSGRLGWLDVKKQANHITNLNELRQLLWPKPQTMALGYNVAAVVHANEPQPRVVLSQDLNHIALTKQQIEKLYEAVKDL